MTLLNTTMDRVTDSAGRPINGGKVYPFLTGTTTPAAVYSNASRTVAHAHPVVASAAGLLPNIYLDPAITYDLKFTDAAGTQIDYKTAVAGAGYGTEPITTQTGAAYNVASGDRGSIVERTHSAAMTATLAAANGTGIGNGYFVTLWNNTSLYDLTVSVSGGGTIDGSASRVLRPGQRVKFISNGTEYKALAAQLSTGKRVYALPAAAWKEAATSPSAAISRYETTTNKITYDGLAFDGASNEFAYCVIVLPKSYKVGTMEFRPRWTAAAGSVGNTVIFGMAGRCFIDDAALDAAYGTAATVSDALLATGDMHVGAWTAFTPASDAADSMLMLRIYRDAATDTHASDAVLIGVDLRFELSASDDA